jgi:hypothetical protein
MEGTGDKFQPRAGRGFCCGAWPEFKRATDCRACRGIRRGSRMRRDPRLAIRRSARRAAPGAACGRVLADARHDPSGTVCRSSRSARRVPGRDLRPWPFARHFHSRHDDHCDDRGAHSGHESTRWLLSGVSFDEVKVSVCVAARMLAKEAQSVSAAARHLGMSERTLQRSSIAASLACAARSRASAFQTCRSRMRRRMPVITISLISTGTSVGSWAARHASGSRHVSGFYKTHRSSVSSLVP